MSLRTSAVRGSRACSGRDVVERAERHARLRQPSWAVGSRLRARPMSTILARPSGVMMMFDGLMSRWTTPRSAAWARPGGHLEHVADGLGDRHGPAAAVDQLPQVLALDELEGDEVQPLVLAAEVDAGDVLVVELGGGPGLLLEAGRCSPGRRPSPAAGSSSATMRPSSRSRARRTAAMPPTPIGSISSKWPSLRPARPWPMFGSKAPARGRAPEMMVGGSETFGVGAASGVTACGSWSGSGSTRVCVEGALASGGGTGGRLGGSGENGAGI